MKLTARLAAPLALAAAAWLPARATDLPIDETVVVHAGDATGAPGETVLVPVWVELKEGAPAVRGWQFRLLFDASALSFQWLEQPSGWFYIEVTSLSPGSVMIWVGSQSRPEPFVSTEPIVLRFCIEGGAPAGMHSLDLERAGFVREDDTDTWYLSAVQAGSIEVAGANDGIRCPPIDSDGYIRKDPVDEAVTFVVGEAAAAPGQADVEVALSILVQPGGPHVSAWWIASLQYDRSALCLTGVQGVRPAYHLTVSGPGGLLAGEKAGTAGDADTIGESNAGLVARLSFCVSAGVPPGIYPIEILEAAPDHDWCDDAPCWFETHFRDPEAIGLGKPRDTFQPVRVAGAIEVSGAPVGGGPCPPEWPDEPVSLRLGEVTVPPGRGTAAVPLYLSVPDGGLRVKEWTAAVRYDPRVIGEAVWRVPPGEPYGRVKAYASGPEDFDEPGKTVLKVQYLDEASYMTSQSDGRVATLQFCVRPDAPQGPSPVSLVPDSPCVAEAFVGGRLSTRHLAPVLQSGTVTVEGEAEDGGCRPDGTVPDPQAVFRLPDAAGSPGGTVTVPLLIRANHDVSGFSFSVDFDEEVLVATKIEKVYRLPDGTTQYGFVCLKRDNSNEVPGNTGIDEGYLGGAVVYYLPDFQGAIPADRDTEVLRFHFAIDPDAPPGTVTEVRFLDGARSDGAQTFANFAIVEGEEIAPGPDAAYVYLSSRIGITGDVSVFVRGDADADGKVLVTDAVSTLSYLFLAGARPPCLDACDADDDGRLNVGDAVYALSFIFLGGKRIPPPYPQPGKDGTQDSLDCAPNGELR